MDLTITVDQQGTVSIGGSSLQNPMLCMGMIEMAKQAIHEALAEKRKSSRIVPVALMPKH